MANLMLLIVVEKGIRTGSRTTLEIGTNNVLCTFLNLFVIKSCLGGKISLF